MENETELVEDFCTIESLDRRWYMALAGSILSVISCISNLIIAKVLLSSKHNHFFFLALLAVSDVFLSLMYTPVIAMDILKERLQMLWLYQIYWFYIGPMLALCHISMTFSSYLIILATIERFLITQRSVYLKWFRANRIFLAFLMLFFSVVLKGPLVFEVAIDERPECKDFPLMAFAPSLNKKLVDTFVYGTIYKFYIRNLFTVFFPFILLALLNYLIVRTLRIQQRSAEMFRFLSSDHKIKIRSATRLMVLIVCSYLVANFLNLVISSWEFIDFESTQSGMPFVIYEFCADLTSLLYVLACATRLPVYYFCNQEIHDTMREFICCEPGLPKSNKCSVVMKSVDPNSTKQIGTELDAVAIAIARHLVVPPEALEMAGKSAREAERNPFAWPKEEQQDENGNENASGKKELLICNKGYRNRDIL